MQLGFVSAILPDLSLREVAQVARRIGFSCVELMCWPPSKAERRYAGVTHVDVTDFSAALVLFMRRRHPAAVITFDEDGLYWHPDHIGVHERVLTAVRSLGADAPPLYYVSMPQGNMPAIVESARARGWAPPLKGFWSLDPVSFGLLAAPHTIAVDVTAQVSQKRAAIAAHRSQMGDNDPFSQMNDVEAARWLGAEYFRRAAIAGIDSGLLEQLCISTS